MKKTISLELCKRIGCAAEDNEQSPNTLSPPPLLLANSMKYLQRKQLSQYDTA